MALAPCTPAAPSLGFGAGSGISLDFLPLSHTSSPPALPSAVLNDANFLVSVKICAQQEEDGVEKSLETPGETGVDGDNEFAPNHTLSSGTVMERCRLWDVVFKRQPAGVAPSY